jgi:hypothetical protein
MDKQKLIFLLVNLLGGIAVIGSYVLGLRAHPGQTEALWGGVPAGIRPFYAINMLFAAAGYLAIFFILLLRVDSSATIGKLPFWTLNLVYLFILVPSALWMSLTFSVADGYTLGRWVAVVSVLALTGLASIGLLVSVISLTPRLPAPLFWVTVIGGIFLVLQTAVLDGIVWTAYYLK